MAWRAMALALLLVAAPVAAVDLEGRLDFDLRVFRPDATREFTPAVAGTVQIFHRFAGTSLRAEAELFYRIDADDDARSGGDLRQAYVDTRAGPVDIALGWRRVFWGVTESRSLVDVLNQEDRAGDITGGDKLGQPMLQLDWHSDWGSASVYLMPRGRKRLFPDADGYPRLPIPIDGGAGRFPDHRSGSLRPDIAARWLYSGRGFDAGLSWFDGSARDPDFLLCAARSPRPLATAPCAPLAALAGIEVPASLLTLHEHLTEWPGYTDLEAALWREAGQWLRLVPEYPRERRLGLDLQYLRGNLALRLEALARQRRGERDHALVAGAEYSLPSFFATGWDVGLIAEYLYDERREDPFNRYYDDDVFVGARMMWNDIAGTTLLAGVITDRDGRDRLYTAEAGRRLGEYWRATLTLRLQDGDGDPLARYTGNQDQARLLLQRFF